MILYAVCTLNLQEEQMILHSMFSTKDKAHEYGNEMHGNYMIIEFVEGTTWNCDGEEIVLE